MLSVKINPEKIRDVIGKGGATIRALTEETGTQIDIGDDGTITISSADLDKAREAERRIKELTADVEVGQEYEGPVLRLLDFGAIVQVLPGRDRSEEHTSELQSLMRISYAVFCLKKNKDNTQSLVTIQHK